MAASDADHGRRPVGKQAVGHDMVAVAAVLQVQAAEFDTAHERDGRRVGGDECIGDPQRIEGVMTTHEADVGAGHRSRETERAHELEVDTGVGETSA